MSKTRKPRAARKAGLPAPKTKRVKRSEQASPTKPTVVKPRRKKGELTAAERGKRAPKTATTRRKPRRAKRAYRPEAPPAPPANRPESILALDPSSSCVGWALYLDGGLAQYGSYVPDGQPGVHGQKLKGLHQWLRDLLALHRPDQLVYETPFIGRNPKVFGTLSMYRGVIVLVHREHYGREVPDANEIPPGAVKQLIKARYGEDHAENKRIVLEMVNREFGLSLKLTQNDISDAIAVNWAWHSLHRRPQEEGDAPRE